MRVVSDIHKHQPKKKYIYIYMWSSAFSLGYIFILSVLSEYHCSIRVITLVPCSLRKYEASIWKNCTVQFGGEYHTVFVIKMETPRYQMIHTRPIRSCLWAKLNFYIRGKILTNCSINRKALGVFGCASDLPAV